jgi:ribosomal protein S27AE
MSEPKIARKCPRCGEVFLVPLVDRALVEEFFRCTKCGYAEPPPDPHREPPDRDRND